MRHLYLFRVLHFGIFSWIKRSKNGAGQLIKYIMQAAFLMLLLIYSPILEKINEDEELQLITAGLLSLIGSGILFLLWDILLAPSRMQRISDNDNKRLRGFISSLNDNETSKRRLSKLYYEGIEIYDRNFEWSEFEEWKNEFERWIQSVDAELKNHWTIKSVHHFRDVGLSGNFQRRRTKSFPTCAEIEKKESMMLLGRYTSCFRAIDHIIRSDEPNYIVEEQELSNISKA
jgi:hypothetical protein